MNLLKSSLTVVLVLLIHPDLHAQKLPGEQKDGLYAPTNVKADGKAIEWGNTFQAFNRATQIFYTMANDDENLYLVIQADQEPTIAKILSGGITLSIKSRVNDKKTPPLTLMYPIISYLDKYTITTPLREITNVEKMMTKVNERLPLVAKQIRISGFSEITDPDISIYNELGIKAVSQVDARRAYTYELQLPVKYFRHLVDGKGAFDYNVTLNGVVDPPGTVVVGGRPAGSPPITGSDGVPVFDMFSPTDFTATYILVKK
ncbi:hypothetical protein [Hufsiella ginkgonis]|uniref:Uncharacterized protein n=1 Tax=Hufsiella ginkgonis TaxID=2695274 RepID=A0A7K1XTZ5_9SPHI|nr:hypothetical protein [Hufsiella ginkgonis]MXV14493.1 hypothetical protein [Hufsiella ginkgonis]